MPNWCENEVMFQGSKEDIDNLKQLLKNTEQGEDMNGNSISVEIPFCFEKLIPMPEKIGNTNFPSSDSDERKKELVAKYGYDNWYDWAISNWGCKWSLGDEAEITYEKDGYIEYEFFTPWAPPVGIYKKLRELFPNVVIKWRFDEPGNELLGYLNRLSEEELDAL
jgi:hypothetical protein